VSLQNRLHTPVSRVRGGVEKIVGEKRRAVKGSASRSNPTESGKSVGIGQSGGGTVVEPWGKRGREKHSQNHSLAKSERQILANDRSVKQGVQKQHPKKRPGGEPG